jgi:three-Cys-motif partner protein
LRHGTADDSTGESLLFPELAAAAPQRLLDGSARLALKTKPRFDQYVFIERDAERCAALETLRGEFPELAADIRVEQGEANQEIRALCREDWRHHRAVLFLDPYGMQVEWPTIEAVAKTQAIDLWLLFRWGSASRACSRGPALSPRDGERGSTGSSAPGTGTTNSIAWSASQRSSATTKSTS